MYNHKTIEAKWREKWNKEGLYKTGEDLKGDKYYILDMFPYPSGAGLHVGHPKGYIATDIFARMKMMQGVNVLHPFGWDAFGLPAENYAIRNKVHPRVAVKKNVATFKSQIEKLGMTYDWSREVNTTDPGYYKWTQWIFLKMLERGLAYESHEPIIWCPSCQTGLANEDLEDGKCERCGSEIERKPMRQWVLKITEYADRMLKDLDKLPEWEDSIKEMQRNWIGRSSGAKIKFQVKGQTSKVKRQLTVFTTRPDTLFGCTYMVLAPEHPLVQELKDSITNFKDVEEYIKKAAKKTDLDRTELNKDKTGVKLEGLTAVNPVNNEEIPVFIADYVMMDYGTGAIMSVPAHDERDWEFALKYDLPIKEVVKPEDSGKNKTILAIHGLCDDSGKHWFPWLEKEFGSRGYKVLNMDMPNPHLPRPEKWLEALRDIKDELTGEVAIIGHSLGAWTACMFIHEENIKVSKLILVGPTSDKGKTIDELVELGLPRESLEYSAKFGEYAVDWDRVSGNVDESIIYLSEDDPYIPMEALHDYERLESRERIFKDRGHFTATTGITEIPELVLDIEGCTPGNGTAVNSGFLDGLATPEAKKKMIEWLEKKNLGKSAVNYKLKDWVFSRQRYWGEPIPVIHCENCGVVPVPEKDLPVELPEVENYEPSGTGESPLANIKDWVNVECPKCGEPAKRETNTMPQWAGSSWYYLRYIDPHNEKELVDKKKEKYWSPVDFYVGGAEHATRHLIYARFWHKFLYDLGVVGCEEPFTRLQHVGLIMAEDGRKMSKRWGNVINPDDIVEKYGADSLRVYEMFMGPFSQSVAWSTSGMTGARKFLEKVWKYFEIYDKDNTEKMLQKDSIKKAVNYPKKQSLLHKTIKKVEEDIVEFKFNTAISQLMILFNELLRAEKDKIGQVSEYITHLKYGEMEDLLKILAPFAPHMCEELWEKLGHKESIFKSEWPQYDEKLIKDETIELVVQVNGKVRDKFQVPADLGEEDIKKQSLDREKILKWTKDKEIVKVIVVKNKLVNIVIK